MRDERSKEIRSWKDYGKYRNASRNTVNTLWQWVLKMMQEINGITLLQRQKLANYGDYDNQVSG